jgi:CRP-like cAMP-binding protein
MNHKESCKLNPNFEPEMKLRGLQYNEKVDNKFKEGSSEAIIQKGDGIKSVYTVSFGDLLVNILNGASFIQTVTEIEDRVKYKLFK